MTEERAIPGSDVAVWISRVGLTDAGKTLIGHELYDCARDTVARIAGFDVQRALLLIEGGRPVPLGYLANCEVLDARPGHPLAGAIEASRTPAEALERAERAELGRFAIDPDRLGSAQARRAVLAVLRETQTGGMPGRADRQAFYAALTRSGDRRAAQVAADVLARLSARFTELGRAVPDDLYWRRAALLRSLGKLQEAVAISDVLDQEVLRDPDDRRILAATRCGALLDLFEATREAPWLASAERAFRIAKEIAPGDEAVERLDNRLRRLRA